MQESSSASDITGDPGYTGEKGLCVPLAIKWCADKNQGVPLFEDMKSRDGLEEVMNIKSAGKNLSEYINVRGLTNVAIQI